jgi:ABC-type branched-subunit amino acid transport system substrate-binding protein
MARQSVDIGTQGNDGTGDSIRESFRKVNDNFREIYAIVGGGDTIGFVNLDDVDLRSLTTKITRSSPDVVYFPLYRASLITFAKQIRQSGYSGTLLSADGISEAEVRILGPSAEGIIITSAYLENEAFERRYLSQFKLAQLDYNLAHVALGHEIAKFLNAAVAWLEARKLQPTTDNLREAVKSITIEDMLGTISFGGKHSI